jgi:hypothetical protein
MLLNDWGIHHLHLSNVIRPDGFVERTGPLLFVIFTDKVAHIIDIAPHKVWTSQHFVEIAVRNWPDEELFLDLKGISPSRPPMTADDYTKMRGAGVGTHIEVDGKVYISKTFGITTAGTSTKVTMEVMHFSRRVAEITDQSKQDPEYLRPYLENSGKSWPAEPEFHLMFVSSQIGFHFAIREEKTGAVFGMWQFFS